MNLIGHRITGFMHVLDLSLTHATSAIPAAKTVVKCTSSSSCSQLMVALLYVIMNKAYEWYGGILNLIIMLSFPHAR
jgi:hypothetical protein